MGFIVPRKLGTRSMIHGGCSFKCSAGCAREMPFAERKQMIWSSVCTMLVEFLLPRFGRSCHRRRRRTEAESDGVSKDFI
eukprot:5832125-Amphidinium_carterae.1